MLMHIVHYADPDLTAVARKALHDEAITHIVEVVDGYLLATVMLIFPLGMYELIHQRYRPGSRQPRVQQDIGDKQPGRLENATGQSDIDDLDRHAVRTCAANDHGYPSILVVFRRQHCLDWFGSLPEPRRGIAQVRAKRAAGWKIRTIPAISSNGSWCESRDVGRVPAIKRACPDANLMEVLHCVE